MRVTTHATLTNPAENQAMWNLFYIAAEKARGLYETCHSGRACSPEAIRERDRSLGPSLGLGLRYYIEGWQFRKGTLSSSCKARWVKSLHCRRSSAIPSI
jgi:hypothetical protein